LHTHAYEYKPVVSKLQEEPWDVTAVQEDFKQEVTTEEYELLQQG
jgi:hypothetical protein